MIHRQVAVVVIGLLAGASLMSCALFHTTTEEDRQARCKLLNRQIIFNGATANTALASQQRAQMDTLSRNYREDNCDDR